MVADIKDLLLSYGTMESTYLTGAHTGAQDKMLMTLKTKLESVSHHQITAHFISTIVHLLWKSGNSNII